MIDRQPNVVKTGSAGSADDVARLRAMIDEAARIAVFTGAGMSTECGIPDFRGPGGLWKTNMPIDFQSFVASAEMRREAWRRKFAMEDVFRAARPGPGHLALADLVASGRVLKVITQNIDNMHQNAGIAAERVIELHGNGSYATCLACGLRHELDEIRHHVAVTGEPPDCPGLRWSGEDRDDLLRPGHARTGHGRGDRGGRGM